MRIKVTKPIVLVGIMGSGKSTIGKKLAKKLHMQFYDSDQVIEEREGLKIVDIYDYRGEEYFKKQEESIIKEVLRYGTIILSTGGGSFANEEVRNLIKEKAISIWLYSDIDTIYERISRRNTRPGLNGENKLEVLESLIEQQYPLLEQADIKINSGNADAHYIVDNILVKLKELC
ncbi:shikimate kinase [endosymbiont of Acanthamoeba sp. UWC8]|uniref:shikimate kinase n=1 Tax=endosymbiont of Acanthamoeba sp. UWC8 TaxID=86106 RepID=UPI0004D18E32|nr:shikimate kinase [endosymbiont of Acanthamoeba sp. UWC8]AIF81740.1 shikimate kinase [endosymbiont of Acanthamoeba sp. UWC8]